MGIELSDAKRENENIYIGVIILLGALIAIIGFRMFDAESKLNELPNCQEDEYLYPRDYLGPGKNDPGDYMCFNFDKENN